MVNVHTLISNASNSFLSSFVSVLGFSWPLWFFGYYLAALHACWFILKWGWSEGTIRSVYKMTDRKPIQKETSLPNQHSVFRKGSLSQVIRVLRPLLEPIFLYHFYISFHIVCASKKKKDYCTFKNLSYFWKKFFACGSTNTEAGGKIRHSRMASFSEGLNGCYCS